MKLIDHDLWSIKAMFFLAWKWFRIHQQRMKAKAQEIRQNEEKVYQPHA
jgi:hypothetical protein